MFLLYMGMMAKKIALQIIGYYKPQATFVFLNFFFSSSSRWDRKKRERERWYIFCDNREDYILR
jgi:hypothetical protein